MKQELGLDQKLHDAVTVLSKDRKTYTKSSFGGHQTLKQRSEKE